MPGIVSLSPLHWSSRLSANAWKWNFGHGGPLERGQKLNDDNPLTTMHVLPTQKRKVLYKHARV
jgi:hypothetical protein